MSLNLNKHPDLVNRIIFLLLALVVYRIGSHIPVPGINPNELKAMFGKDGGIFQMLDMFSGGGFSRFTVFALGIMPYISASIIFQLGSEVVPSLREMKKDGESGRRKITQYTRYLTVVIAVAQALGFIYKLIASPNVVIVPSAQFIFMALLCLVTGSLFIMWLGEQITERGIGNGSSMIITAGIMSGLPSALSKTKELVSNGSLSWMAALFILVAVIAVTWFVVFVEKAQRKILINYAKQQAVGSRVASAQPPSYLPLKLNMAGVIPPIFASSIILFLATVTGSLANWTSKWSALSFLSSVPDKLHPGQPVYVICYAAAIIFFAFFYTALVFNPKETSDNLKKSGAFVPGIRPGEQTGRYLEKVILRLTLLGAIYIALVCLLPEFLVLKWNVPFYFGGTSLLILVVVTIDFISQVQSSMMSQQYEGLLKKANNK